VNLERSLRLADRLDGHLVSGHVDGVGRIRSAARNAESVVLWIEAPATLVRYVAEKGSIAVDGVSLTVNELAGAAFRVNLIPFTADHTTLGALAADARVNLEIDLVARYLERLLSKGAVPG
jgi:riboflavin synthase